MAVALSLLIYFISTLILIFTSSDAIRMKSTAKLLVSNSILKTVNPVVSSLDTTRSDCIKWIDLKVSPDELRPNLTLIMGQCFNWKKIDVTDNCFIGTIGHHTLAIKQTETSTYYSHINYKQSNYSNGDIDSSKEVEDCLHSYFQLEYSMTELYKEWAVSCSRMGVVTSILKGVRVLRQDPWECLVSFICSSNNNIKRITLMLDRLRYHYGTYICSIRYEGNDFNTCQIFYSEPTDAEMLGITQSPVKMKKKRPAAATQTPDDDINDDEIKQLQLSNTVATAVNSNNIHHMYRFPTIDSLAVSSEEDLRGLGMGYRAKFLVGTAKLLQSKGGEKWLHELREIGRDDTSADSSASDVGVSKKTRLKVQETLIECPGVGKKVADCVALFSLDQCSAIPVDTHVWDIAARDYNASLIATKSLTPTIYEQVGDVFRNRFGNKAGWAHSVLFAAELPDFRIFLPVNLQQEMKAFALDMKNLRKLKANKNAAVTANDDIMNDDIQSNTAATANSSSSSGSSSTNIGNSSSSGSSSSSRNKKGKASV